MVTLNQIVDDIRAIASSGSNPDNFKIPNEQIQYWIKQTRAMLIGQSLAKKDDLNDTWLQQINCMELETADESECCLAPSNCYVLKTVEQIPATIATPNEKDFLIYSSELTRIYDDAFLNFIVLPQTSFFCMSFCFT